MEKDAKQLWKNQKRNIITLRWRHLATAAAVCTMHRHLLFLYVAFCILLCNRRLFQRLNGKKSQTIRSVLFVGDFHFRRICDTPHAFIHSSLTTTSSTAPCVCVCVCSDDEQNTHLFLNCYHLSNCLFIV